MSDDRFSGQTLDRPGAGAGRLHQPNHPPTLGDKASAVIKAAEGGQPRGHGAKLTIPPGALPADTKLTLEAWPSSYLATLADFVPVQKYIQVVIAGNAAHLPRPLSIFGNALDRGVIVVGADDNGVRVHGLVNGVATTLTWPQLLSLLQGWAQPEFRTVDIFDLPLKPEAQRKGSLALVNTPPSPPRFYATGQTPHPLVWDGKAAHPSGYYWSPEGSQPLGSELETGSFILFNFRVTNTTDSPQSFQAEIATLDPKGSEVMKQTRLLTLNAYSISDPLIGEVKNAPDPGEARIEFQLYSTNPASGQKEDLQDIKFFRFVLK